MKYQQIIFISLCVGSSIFSMQEQKTSSFPVVDAENVSNQENNSQTLTSSPKKYHPGVDRALLVEAQHRQGYPIALKTTHTVK